MGRSLTLNAHCVHYVHVNYGEKVGFTLQNVKSRQLSVASLQQHNCYITNCNILQNNPETT